MTNPDGIRAIAFDLDGTLVDSAPGLAAAMDKAMKEQGFPAPGEERVTLWIGNGADMLVKRALAWANAEPSEALCQRVRAGFDFYYANSAENGSRLYPQVRETLRELYRAGFPLALVTNKPTPFVRPMLSALNIESFFREIIGGDDVAMKKPHPAPLYLVMAKLGLHAGELLFVGDSRNDIQAAKSAGCRSVGVTYGYNYGEPIARSEPDHVLPGISGLLPMLGLPSLNHQEL